MLRDARTSNPNYPFLYTPSYSNTSPIEFKDDSHPLRLRVRTKMFLGLLVVFAASMILLHLILSRQTTRSMEETVASDLVTLRNSTEVYVRQVMLMENNPDLDDPETAKRILPPLLEELRDSTGHPVAFYSSAQGLRFYTKGGYYITEEKYPAEAFRRASFGRTAYQLRYDNETFYEVQFIMPIIISGVIEGYLMYNISYTDMLLEKIETTNTALRVTLVVMGIALIFSYLLLSHLISPLNRLSDITSRFKENVTVEELKLQKENLSGQLVRRRDEIGDLSKNYAEMLDTIQHQLGTIETQLKHIRIDRTRIYQLLSSRQTFFDNVTHELKTPLTTIRGYAQLIQENGTADPELVKVGLDHILNESSRLHTMVLQLLEISNVRSDYQLHHVDLTTLLQSVTKAMELKANRYQNHLLLTCPSYLPVRGQDDRLRQLLINLIDNAIKYGMPGEPIAITAGRRKKDGVPAADEAIQGRSAAASQTMIYLSVKNNGKGMLPEQLEHIFDPFYRVDKNYSREQGSSGLGLSICQKIAEEHQAQIEVQSAPEGPTVFTVWFPDRYSDNSDGLK